MDLPRYERLKFELAELIRTAQLAAPGGGGADPWPGLLTRLAEDRFTVVVAGRFSRGKSSLMNAVLGTDRLPTGVVPVTSVITSVRYGSSERLVVDYLGGRARGTAAVEELEALVTAQGNPGNERGVRAVEIQLPAEILRRGFYFVDTPGLGSTLLESSETTERFIPEIDLLLLVTGFEGPLSEDEARFLRQAAATVRAVFVVVNKQDGVPPPARDQVMEYVERAAGAALGGRPFRLFSVSARDGLAAKRANDAARLRASGLPVFEAELVSFLARERAGVFLSSTCDRVLAGIESLPGPGRGELRPRLRGLAARIDAAAKEVGPPGPDPAGTLSAGPQRATPPAFSGCEVCAAIEAEEHRFLARYQLELSTQAPAREAHAARGGFCPFHTWHYERITSPRAVCTAYPPTLERAASLLRSPEASARPFAALAPRCPACELRGRTEEDALTLAAERAGRPGPGGEAELPRTCLPHLRPVLSRLRDEAARRRLLAQQAAWLERAAEDMQRYAVKHDGLRRWLTSAEERGAPQHALELLAGRRRVSGASPGGDGD